jgi:hypothetical protein
MGNERHKASRRELGGVGRVKDDVRDEYEAVRRQDMSGVRATKGRICV